MKRKKKTVFVNPGEQKAGVENTSKPKNKPALWINVKFSDGVRYKIPAAVVARPYAIAEGISHADALCQHDELIKFASQGLSWLAVQPYAQLQYRDTADYIAEWSTVKKSVGE